MNITELNIYPLKSGRRIALQTAAIGKDGLAGDRRFMVVKPDGAFITQRELALLAQIDASVASENQLILQMNDQSLVAGFHPANRMVVEIWGSAVDAAVAADAANATLSVWLGRPVKLVQMDARAHRSTSEDWAAPDSPVAFADGFQVLITTTASLADLNQTMRDKGLDPVGMDRFRSNIVIDCDAAWDEDTWQTVQIGDVVLDLVKPCARCIMTTQDQITGDRIGGDPIKGLAAKRMSADRRVPGPLFGWNAVPRHSGTVSVGDRVTVLLHRSDRWPMKTRP